MKKIAKNNKKTKESVRIGKNILEKLLTLVNDHLFSLKADKVYIDIVEIKDALGIKIPGDWESELCRLNQILKTIN